MDLEEKQTLNEPQEPSDPGNNSVADPSQQQQSQGQSLDPNLYDEDGIPWKNRAKEYERKYSDSVNQMQVYERKQADFIRQQQAQGAQQQQSQNDPYGEILSAQDPKKQLEMIEQRIVGQIRTEMFNSEKQKSFQRAFSKHSDLNDRNSQFYKAVVDEIRYMTSIGLDMNKSPNIVETIADRIALRNSNNNQHQRPQQPGNLPMVGTTSSKQPKPINNNDLPPMPNAMNNALNSVRYMSSEDRKIIEKKIRERQARGEFNIIGEGDANRGM